MSMPLKFSPLIIVMEADMYYRFIKGFTGVIVGLLVDFIKSVLQDITGYKGTLGG